MQAARKTGRPILEKRERLDFYRQPVSFFVRAEGDAAFLFCLIHTSSKSISTGVSFKFQIYTKPKKWETKRWLFAINLPIPERKERKATG
ncbi:hypothetical protein [Allobaculum sp. Allo2]|uniref:hypothetical protein n=1 Tax=Allobaculum sp. Allo2 TaxID=2853432 RepID=UPI001F614D2B|nr:hypothetical protein [Allobaculum sp. Allo2]UNT93587.1 hypothetical protein KWG61_02030 [Allobaculum sp. Allo2]